MLAGSFRLVTARLIPRGYRCKQALPLVAALILAGCGGSSAPKATGQTVAGPGFSFEAPAGWRIERAARQVTASRDSELVRVASFPLVKSYSPGLFDRVAGELDLRMADVASRTGGKVSGKDTVTVAGIRSHAYDVDVGDHVDEYTFVLRGKREYLLLCRRRSSSGSEFCQTLATSFAPA
jgi:hypothetical protein